MGWRIDPVISRRMRANPSFDTTPELAIRSKLYRAGLRFRKHHEPWEGSGFKPDIVFTRMRVVVFIDGCFWHGCP